MDIWASESAIPVIRRDCAHVNNAYHVGEDRYTAVSRNTGAVVTGERFAE